MLKKSNETTTTFRTQIKHSHFILVWVFVSFILTGSDSFTQNYWKIHWLPQGFEIRDLILDSKDNLYVACELYGLFRSSDNGRTFEKLDFSPWLFYRFDKNSEDHIFLGTDGGGFSKTTDGGESWFVVGFSRKKVTDIEVVHDTFLFTGIKNEGIFRSSDDGATWEQVWSQYPSSPKFHFERTTATLYCLPYGKLFKSSDLGETWSEVFHPWRAEKDTSQVIALSSNSRGDLFAAVRYGREESRTAIIRSTDGGVSWAVVGATREYVHRIVVNSLDHIFWVSDPGIPKRSRDNGTTWEDLREGLDGPRYFRSLALGPDERLYAGSLGYIAISIQSTVVGAEPTPLPRELSLSQNYPNPARELTSVSFSLSQAGAVILSLHNVLGTKVQTVIGGDLLPPGEHSATLDVGTLPAGVYVLRLHVAGSVVSRMVLVGK